MDAIDSSKGRALFIIDVQNDFTEGGALGVDGGGEVAVSVTSLLTRHPDRYAQVFASRDWHNPDTDNGGHFAAEPDFVRTWPVHCVAGTDGASYHPELILPDDTIHIRKGQGTPAYSIFEGSSESGESTGAILDRLGITNVDIAGIATDYCVLASAQDALSAGRRVRILTGLVAGVAPSTSAAALHALAAGGAELIDTV